MEHSDEEAGGDIFDYIQTKEDEDKTTDKSKRKNLINMLRREALLKGKKGTRFPGMKRE